jgi:hypothetical protein
VVSDNVIDGTTAAYPTLRVHPQNNVSAERIRDIIVERNRVVGVQAAGSFSVATGFTVRNNIFRTTAETILEIRGQSSVGSPPPSQNWLYNNSCYSTTTGNFVGVFLIGTHSGIAISDNSIYAPSAVTADVAFGGTPGVTYTLTNNSTDTQVRTVNPFVLNPPVTIANFRPAGYAVASAVGTVVWDDLNAATRTLPRSMGALNP